MYCSKCSAENLRANFCFSCARPVSANLEFLSCDQKVDSFGGAAFGDILTQIRNSSFVVRECKFEIDFDKRLKIALKVICAELVFFLTINDFYNLYNLINLYRI